VVSRDVLVGLDVGTSAVKATVIDTEGREVAAGRAPTPWRTVPTGAELDPDALLAAAVAAAAGALADAAPARVLGLGVASMAETGVLLDGAGRPAVPAIAWHDARGSAEAERMAADLGGEAFAARVGLPCTSLCTLAKYAWMREHWPDAARGARWLNVAEWIVLGLGGAPFAELSLASRTGFYDLHARRPWDEALAWAGAPAGLMPDAVPAATAMGAVDGTLAAAQGAVLTVGGHDHLAAAVGAGAAGDGDVLDSCGTAEAFVRASAPLPADRVARAVADGITVGWHADARHHALLGAIWSGAALARVLGLLGVEPERRDGLEAAAGEALSGDLALAGVEAGGALALTGIDRDTSPGAAYRAALEAVGVAGADVLERMAAVAGPARRLVVTGGWAAGPAARAVKEHHLGPFEHSPALSTGARGAALAAGGAAGLWPLAEAPRSPA
jgi:sugar (pentulose or hexulose) kinase